VSAHWDNIATFGFRDELEGDFVARNAGKVKVCLNWAEDLAHEAEEHVQIS
jgi:hypothetical protein